MFGMLNPRNRGKPNPNSWHQSQRGILRNCEPRTRRSTGGFHDQLDRKHCHHGNNFWNQRRREVIQHLDCLKLCHDPEDYKARLMYMKNAKKMRRSRCYICLVRGHAYWNCPNKNRRGEFKKGKHEKEKKNKESRTENKEEIGIEKATASKHHEIITPSLNWQVIGTDDGGWDDIWYVSDEYPRHMTPNMKLFDKFKSENTGSSATGEDSLNIQGIGEVIVKTETRMFVIPGVLYVPNAGLNTLSLNQLVQQGFEVIFKNTNCTVKRLFDDTNSEDSGSDEEEKDCVEKQDRLGLVREKAIEAVMKYCDSLYFTENTIQENLDGNQGPRVPSRYEFESLIGFIEMVNEQEIIKECKELVKNHFEKMVQWFYKDYMQSEERPIPVRINGTEICLLDLYLTVKGMGGHTQVAMKNKWINVAYAMGFPKEYAYGLEACYGTHLSLLEAYYGVAKDYSSGVGVPKAKECMGTSGIKAKVLPKEETSLGRIGTKAMQAELDDEERLSGKIEFDDGETLIITFEDNCSNEEPTGDLNEEDVATRVDNESGKGMDRNNNDGDYIIVND